MNTSIGDNTDEHAGVSSIRSGVEKQCGVSVKRVYDTYMYTVSCTRVGTGSVGEWETAEQRYHFISFEL